MTVAVQRSPQAQSTPNSSSSTPPAQTPSAGETSPAPYPRQICGEPRQIPVHDEQLGMCYDLTVYCGVTPELAIERFRRYQQAQNLARNVGVRIHQNSGTPPSPTTPPSNNNNSPSVIQGVFEFILGLTPLGWAGCSSGSPNTVPEVPDASPPPPNTDPACSSRRTYIQDNDPLRTIRGPEAAADGGASTSASARVLAELQRQYPGIEFPTLNVTYEGSPFLHDSAGQAVSEIHTSDPVSFVRIDNRLYVLTANRVGEAYAPATLLVYDVGVSPPRPVPTTDFATLAGGGSSNAIVLVSYNPVAMAPMVGMSEIDILFGAPNGGTVTTIDPYSNEIIAGDWCSTHDVDGGTPSDGAVDVPDASVDASRDASDAGPARDADAGAGNDGSAG